MHPHSNPLMRCRNTIVGQHTNTRTYRALFTLVIWKMFAVHQSDNLWCCFVCLHIYICMCVCMFAYDNYRNVSIQRILLLSEAHLPHASKSNMQEFIQMRTHTHKHMLFTSKYVCISVHLLIIKQLPTSFIIVVKWHFAAIFHTVFWLGYILYILVQQMQQESN